MSFVPINPRPMLQDLVNKDVEVRLKWGETCEYQRPYSTQESLADAVFPGYRGRLISIDSYMNVQLSNTEEYIDHKLTGALGQVLIR